MNINNFKKRLVTTLCSAVLVGSLSACVKPDISDAVPVQTIAEREDALKKFKPWRALGSIAIDSVEEGKYNASFAWDVDDQGFEIKLFGPLGVQVVHVEQNKNGARITDRDGTIEGENAELLLADVLGTQVPINQMQHWAVGLPGEATELQRDEVGRPESMIVSGDNSSWMIDYQRYLVLEDMYLPKTVAVESDDVTIKLSFKKWSRGEVVDNGRLSIPGVGS